MTSHDIENYRIFVGPCEGTFSSKLLLYVQMVELSVEEKQANAKETRATKVPSTPFFMFLCFRSLASTRVVN